MLLGGLHPLLWILMPGFIALFTGIPYLMMCAKVQKVGSVLLMGLITGLATETSEELSAAAVTRGIENPVRKTSAVSLRLSPMDLLGMLAVLALLVLSFVIQ